ncbi:hypothetical protein BDB01DRAFT_798315 [Pilobolus umbonatus]|nr:hypothetical protein BDB01DRAFT_798315 [Pilobolus umbonatus]
MDLSWCIICDCHCIEDNLYCSESCRIQDVTLNNKQKNNTITTKMLVSPPSSPILDPYLASYNNDRRTSVTFKSANRPQHESIFGYMSPSSVPRYSLS